MYVYVLGCDAQDIYVGITSNLIRRVDQHKTRLVQSTKKYSRIELLHWWNAPTYILASKFERWCHSNMSYVGELVLDCPIWSKLLTSLAETKKTTDSELLRAVKYSKLNFNL